VFTWLLTMSEYSRGKLTGDTGETARISVNDERMANQPARSTRGTKFDEKNERVNN